MPGIPGPDARIARSVPLGASGGASAGALGTRAGAGAAVAGGGASATRASAGGGATSHWDDVGHAWTAAQPEALWRLHSDAINRRLLARWLPAGLTPRLLKTDLFDEAATGGLHDLLKERAALVVGMDVSAVTAREARRRANGLTATRADARALPFADAAFDVIVSNSTLDHFETRAEIVASLRELRRILKPGGRLILTLDNMANPVVAVRNAIPFAWLKRLGIMRYFVGVSCGPRGMRRLLAESGWRVEEMDAVLHCPRFFSIQVGEWLHRHAGAGARHRYLDVLQKFEGLARWPTRYLTGYFVAARAVRDEAAPPLASSRFDSTGGRP